MPNFPGAPWFPTMIQGRVDLSNDWRVTVYTFPPKKGNFRKVVFLFGEECTFTFQRAVSWIAGLDDDIQWSELFLLKVYMVYTYIIVGNPTSFVPPYSPELSITHALYHNIISIWVQIACDTNCSFRYSLTWIFTMLLNLATVTTTYSISSRTSWKDILCDFMIPWIKYHCQYFQPELQNPWP